MKPASDALHRHLCQRVTHLACCWRIIRQDDRVITLTEHDRDLTFGGETYLALSSFRPTTISAKPGLSIDNLEVTAVLDSAAISEDDVRGGRYDDAKVEIFYVVWDAPDAYGKLPMFAGQIADIEAEGLGFKASLTAKAEALNTDMLQCYSLPCRADFGDADCGIDKTALSVAGIVTTFVDETCFVDTSRSEAAGTFTYGTIEWTSGANAGWTSEVSVSETGVFRLDQPTGRPIAMFDHYKAYPGCSKLFDDAEFGCVKWANQSRFRGEPFIPGNSAASSYPGMKVY